MTDFPEEYHEAMGKIIARNLLLQVKEPNERQRGIIEAAGQLAQQIASCTQRIRDEGATELVAAQHMSAFLALHQGLRQLRSDGCRGSIAFEIFDDAANVSAMIHRCEDAVARA